MAAQLHHQVALIIDIRACFNGAIHNWCEEIPKVSKVSLRTL